MPEGGRGGAGGTRTHDRRIRGLRFPLWPLCLTPGSPGQKGCEALRPVSGTSAHAMLTQSEFSQVVTCADPSVPYPSTVATDPNFHDGSWGPLPCARSFPCCPVFPFAFTAPAEVKHHLYQPVTCRVRVRTHQAGLRLGPARHRHRLRQNANAPNFIFFNNKTTRAAHKGQMPWRAARASIKPPWPKTMSATSSRRRLAPELRRQRRHGSGVCVRSTPIGLTIWSEGETTRAAAKRGGWSPAHRISHKAGALPVCRDRLPSGPSVRSFRSSCTARP